MYAPIFFFVAIQSRAGETFPFRTTRVVLVVELKSCDHQVEFTLWNTLIIRTQFCANPFCRCWDLSLDMWKNRCWCSMRGPGIICHLHGPKNKFRGVHSEEMSFTLVFHGLSDTEPLSLWFWAAHSINHTHVVVVVVHDLLWPWFLWLTDLCSRSTFWFADIHVSG